MTDFLVTRVFALLGVLSPSVSCGRWFLCVGVDRVRLVPYSKLFLTSFDYFSLPAVSNTFRGDIVFRPYSFPNFGLKSEFLFLVAIFLSLRRDPFLLWGYEKC